MKFIAFIMKKKNSENPILARYSDRREVTKINQAKRKSRYSSKRRREALNS